MGDYRFPDVPAALLDVVPHSVLWLTSYDGTVNHIYSAGGSQSGPLRFDRIVINTYAPGRDAAHAEAERVRELVLGCPHETAEGLLDYAEVEVVPHDILFVSDVTSQYQGIYRVYTRPLPTSPELARSAR